MKQERIPIGDKVKIYQRGKKKNWVADFWHNGKHCRKSLKTSNKKIATVKAVKLASELSSGEYQVVKTNILIEDAIEKYFSSKENDPVRESSITKYRNDLKNLLGYCDERGVKYLTEIVPSFFDEYRRVKGKIWGPNTLHNSSKTCKSFLDWCKSRHLVSQNSLENLKLRKPVACQRAVPSIEELRNILISTCGLDRLMLTTLSMTGLRGGELKYLRHYDVDLTDNWIHVVPRVGEQQKEHIERKVPIHPELRKYLLRHHITGDGWFFQSTPSHQNPNGGCLMSQGRLNTVFKSVAGRFGHPVGTDQRGLTLHALRRFFETESVKSGIPQQVIDLWMGHTGGKSMSKIYFTLKDEESQRFIKKLNFSPLLNFERGATNE